MRNRHYEEDDEHFTSSAYRVAGYSGVAFRVLGWETEPDEDTHWSGYEVRTGRVACVMIGDDYVYSVEESDLTPLERHKYCGQCGQIGCHHDGYEEDDE